MKRLIAIAMFLVGVASVLTTPTSTSSSDPSLGQGGVLPHIALVSDEPGVVTTEVLARNFQAQLDDAEHLKIHSELKIVYSVRQLPVEEDIERDPVRAIEKLYADPTLPDPSVLNIAIDSTMTPTTLSSVFGRDDVDRPVNTLYIDQESGYLERYYWKADEAQVTSVEFDPDQKKYFMDMVGVDILLDGLWMQCDTSVFWMNWLDDSGPNSWNWEPSISIQGAILEEELVVYNGVMAFRVKIPANNQSESDWCNLRTDYYYISQETGQLIGWQKYILRSIVGGKEEIHVSDMSFDYDFGQNSASLVD